MGIRNLGALSAAILTGAVGVVALIAGNRMVGSIAVLVLEIFIVALVLLQRRQFALVQQRLLAVLKAVPRVEKRKGKQPAPFQSASAVIDSSLAISTKKLLGVLQAQQIQLDEMSDKINLLINEKYDNNEG